ncbi:MAG: DUF1080 domain-containing protein [Pirellulales bacterium]
MEQFEGLERGYCQILDELTNTTQSFLQLQLANNTKQRNTGRVVCKGTIIQHWLNGEKVIHFDYEDPKWAFNVDMLRQRGGNLNARGANLSLQDHGDPVWYQNIRLRELKETDSIDMVEVLPATIPAHVLEAEKKKLAGIVKRREDSKRAVEK